MRAAVLVDQEVMEVKEQELSGEVVAVGQGVSSLRKGTGFRLIRIYTAEAANTAAAAGFTYATGCRRLA
nr:hypothetical protein [Paenibacillus sp. AR247]